MESRTKRRKFPPIFLFEQHQPQSVMKDQESTSPLGGADRRHRLSSPFFLSHGHQTKVVLL
jgi:hypothetical protein